MGETKPGIKSMRKSVAAQQHQQQHYHKREVAQAQVHPVPGAEVLELQEYVAVGDSGDLEAAAPRSPQLKLTARTREAHPTTRRRKVSDETKEEIQEEDEATLRELLVRYVTCLGHTKTHSDTVLPKVSSVSGECVHYRLLSLNILRQQLSKFCKC